MATRSTISIQKNDGTIRSVYCHWDGYCEHNGYGYDPKARAEFNKGRYWSTTNGNRTPADNDDDAEARALSLGDKDANLGSHTRTNTYPQKFTVRLFRK